MRGLRNSVVYMHVETCTHIGMFFNLKKEGNLVTCNNMDETVGYYAKKNEPDRQRQILCAII